MAAPKGNSNGIGNSGGKSLQDRLLAAEVRNLTLEKIKEILMKPVVKMDSRDLHLHDEILVKLAGTVLPRLTELSGEGGGPILVAPTTKQEVDKAIHSFLNGKPRKDTGE